MLYYEVGAIVNGVPAEPFIVEDEAALYRYFDEVEDAAAAAGHRAEVFVTVHDHRLPPEDCRNCDRRLVISVGG